MLPDPHRDAIIQVPQLLQAQYPRVKYWFRATWRDRKKVTQIDRAQSPPPNGAIKGLRYVEDENGEPIDRLRANAMRKHARGLWALMARKGCAPPTWGAIDAATHSHYHHDMAIAYPELAYCHDNWKSDQIAIETYPNWQSGKKSKTIKQEPGINNDDDDDDEDDDEDGNIDNNDRNSNSNQRASSKRPRSHSRNPPAKRSKRSPAPPSFRLTPASPNTPLPLSSEHDGSATTKVSFPMCDIQRN